MKKEEKKVHDFKEPIEKTSVVLAKIVLDSLSENFNSFVYEDIDITPEQERALIEKTTDVSIEILSKMATSDIPADYATLSIDKLIAALQAMKMYVDGTVRQMENEILSRSLGAKSPVTNTYAKDCASLGEVMLLLTKVREETGNNPDDYFVKNKN